jgi:hypothetical protein
LKGKEANDSNAAKHENGDVIYPDYLNRKFPIIKNAQSYSLSDILNSPDKMGFARTEKDSFYPNGK